MKKKARKTRRQLIAEKTMLSKNIVDKANAITDPFAILEPFHHYTTPDNIVIDLHCIKAKDADTECMKWIYDIMNRNMKNMYEQSSLGWDETEKHTELTEPGAQYLIATHEKKFVGFSHFRFDTDDGVEVLYCYELQLEPEVRRKGLGRFIMLALENMAFLYKMKKVVLTSFNHNPIAIKFYYGLGYKLDSTSPPTSEQMDYVILSKYTTKPPDGSISISKKSTDN